MEFDGMRSGSGVIMLMTLFLGLCLAGTLAMLLVLILKGDERKKMLVCKSSLIAVIGAVICLIFGFIYTSFIVPHVNFVIELNPIMYLGVISIIFDLAYFYYRRKYGD